MTRARAWIEYEAGFDAVLAHVYDHPDELLDLFRLAEVAGFSPRHWHRIFVSAFGESLPALVKRVRIQRAVALLAEGAMPVRQVARECGYPDVSSFTRTFKAMTGTTPARYRDSGTHADLRLARAHGDPDAFDVQVRSVGPIDCLALRHRGSYLTIDRAFHELRVRLAALGHDLAAQEMYGVYLSDPTATAEEDLESLACVTRPQGAGGAVEPPSSGADDDGRAPGVQEVTIRGGPYAVLTHVGAYADMPDTYRWFFGQWVPHHGRQLADAPVVEHYVTNPQVTAPTANRVELMLPLAGGERL